MLFEDSHSHCFESSESVDDKNEPNKDEVKAAIKHLKKGKAQVSHFILIEVIKASVEYGV